jgi:hypothetical protein
MMGSIDGLCLLIHPVVFVCALIGPERNPANMVPLKQKLDALALLERTGDESDCESVVAAIRLKKAAAEERQKVRLRGKKQLEDGIARYIQNLQNSGTIDDQLTRERGLEACLSRLEIVKALEAWTDYVIAGRVAEERAFSRLVQAIKAKQPDRKEP